MLILLWSNTSIDITVSNNGFLRSLQEIQYTDDAGGAQTVSAAGNIWFKLGSTSMHLVLLLLQLVRVLLTLLML